MLLVDFLISISSIIILKYRWLGLLVNKQIVQTRFVGLEFCDSFRICVYPTFYLIKIEAQCSGSWTNVITEDIPLNSNLFTSQIEPNSVASRCGDIFLGDRIIKINGELIRSRFHVIDLFNQSSDVATLLVARQHPLNPYTDKIGAADNTLLNEPHPQPHPHVSARSPVPVYPLVRPIQKTENEFHVSRILFTLCVIVSGCNGKLSVTRRHLSNQWWREFQLFGPDWPIGKSNFDSQTATHSLWWISCGCLDWAGNRRFIGEISERHSAWPHSSPGKENAVRMLGSESRRGQRLFTVGSDLHW